MKLRTLLTIILVATFSFSCKNEAKPEIKTIKTASESKTKLDPNATYTKAEFTINGMTCKVGCAKTIEEKMSKMEGVKSAKVDFDRKLAMVEYNKTKVTPILLEETVSKVATIYSVSDMKTVEVFSTKKECTASCTKVCCANKTEAEKKISR